MTDFDIPPPAVSPGTARFIAQRAAEAAVLAAEVERKRMQGEAVLDAIRRTAWRVALIVAILPAPAFAHDWYHTLTIPGSEVMVRGGISCCDNQDCAPARVRQNAAGWEAETPAGAWASVPDNRIIRDKTHPAGSAVLCLRDGRVLCFVPPAAGG